ncbi:hypothetical protein [Flavobacterium sp. GSB-24]|uniref:hypothetical protein n=1 Tax=Flavobacterium sp. GSB-24 TaxID=2994319 RepID=UPI002491D104|nr:hypothetical protein [Flavobacterium sp. GSB-24]BDU26917.1 hypothetical protein FLGSB24_36610 [Flavobacterium sp. GSB-24]
MICVIFATLILGCSDNDSKQDDYILAQIDASDLPKDNRPMTMFEDDESPSKMYDNNDRWFRVNEPLQIILKGKDSVQISLYSPVGLSNVKVYAKLRNYDKRFLIYNFSKIPAFHRSFHKIPLTDKGNQYELESGGTVTIERIEGISSDDITFSLQSDDPLFQKFKRIKSSRLVAFSDKYHLSDPNPNSYLPMNPVLAKEAITMIINFSYVLSHPLYYDTFMNFDRYKKEQMDIEGLPLEGALNWHGNAEDINGVYDYFTEAQMEDIYANYIDGRKLYMAMVGGENAWGGGPLASHWESYYVVGHWIGDMSVWTHEYGHHSGYQHTSNLVNRADGGGLQTMVQNLYKYLIYIEDLPFLDPDVLKTYNKSKYLQKSYNKPVFKIKPLNPFLVKYKGEGKW